MRRKVLLGVTVAVLGLAGVGIWLLAGSGTADGSLELGLITAEAEGGDLVLAVTAGGAGARAGVEVGDLITSIDGRPVEGSPDRVCFREVQVGTEIALLREGRSLICTVGR